MTAIPGRRTRGTLVALAASVLSIAAVAVLAIAGVRTLSDSTAGRLAEGQTVALPVTTLPYTSTALIGVVDEDGRLTSAAVAVLEPDFVGGTLVALAATADAGSGNTFVVEPLDAVLQVEGPTAFRESAEQLTALSFDVIEIVDQQRLTRLLTPLGDLPADLPIDVSDSSSGEQWRAGETVLSSAAAARLLTAHDDAIEDWYFEPARQAVWEAIADRVGAGIGSAQAVGADQNRPPIATLDEFLARLFAGRVTARPLGFVLLDEDRLAAELSPGLAGAFGPGSIDAAVVHTRSEVLLVFGSLAPARMGAPIDGLAARITGAFSDADLEGVTDNRADVLRYAIDRMLFLKTNVVAVAELPPTGAPERTQILVSDPALLADVQSFYGDLMGASDVGVSPRPIDGVDLEIQLGRDFLPLLPSN